MNLAPSSSEEVSCLLLHAYNKASTFFFWCFIHMAGFSSGAGGRGGSICVYVRQRQTSVDFCGEFSNSPNNKRMEKQWMNWCQCLLCHTLIPVQIFTKGINAFLLQQADLSLLRQSWFASVVKLGWTSWTTWSLLQFGGLTDKDTSNIFKSG